MATQQFNKDGDVTGRQTKKVRSEFSFTRTPFTPGYFSKIKDKDKIYFWSHIFLFQSAAR